MQDVSYPYLMSICSQRFKVQQHILVESGDHNWVRFEFPLFLLLFDFLNRPYHKSPINSVDHVHEILFTGKSLATIIRKVLQHFRGISSSFDVIPNIQHREFLKVGCMRDSLNFTLFQQEFLSTQHICGELLIHISLGRAVHATFILEVVHEDFSIGNLRNEFRRCQFVESALSWLSLLHLVLLLVSQKGILKLLSIAILRLHISILV